MYKRQLLGDIARLHEAVLAYARDFMIDKGFTYVIPPFMMHGDVVTVSYTHLDVYKRQALRTATLRTACCLPPSRK